MARLRQSKQQKRVAGWIENDQRMFAYQSDPKRSTALVSYRLGRQFIGCEINPEYYESGNTRLEMEMSITSDKGPKLFV